MCSRNLFSRIVASSGRTTRTTFSSNRRLSRFPWPWSAFTGEVVGFKSAQISRRDFRVEARLIKTEVRRHIASAATMSKVAEESSSCSGDVSRNSQSSLDDTSTIIRYQLGDERFQMQLTLNSGKVFNFDRRCGDTVGAVVARFVTNISKKVKTFNGVVKFLLEEDAAQFGEDTEIERILEVGFKSGALKLQIGEDVYNVIFNPPEVYTVKFFTVYMPTFPLFPYRMETSGNFCKGTSLYKWEFSRDPPRPEVPLKLRKKSKDESTKAKGSNEVTDSWNVCGSEFIFTPEKGMEGGYLRFTCTPSNGSVLGRPFTISLPSPIGSLPVDNFLYHERLSRMSPTREEGDVLRVVSYNVLADTYATPEWFISSPKECLDVGYRLPILNEELRSYGADLICLQEVDEKYFEGNFQPYMSVQGYNGFHTSKTGKTNEGIATFHNPSKLTSISSNYIAILEHMKSLPLWTRLKQVGNDFVQKLEERNTVFQVSVFRVNYCPNTILVVGNVHLYFHPEADHIRLIQTITCINFLESKLDEIRKQYPDHKISLIYCGDLNCTPPFSSKRLLTSGEVLENDEDWSSHSEDKIVPGISFKHNLNLSNSHPGEELTNITTCFEGCLDYILYQAEHFELANTYPPPNKEELARLTNVDEPRKLSFPSFYTASDHLPLIADLRFKNA